MIPLRILRIGKFIETGSRIEVIRGLRKDGELLFSGYRVSVWGDEKVLEMDSPDGCITV